MPEKIKLTQFSHGAGCGCKISPQVLDEILSHSKESKTHFRNLLVGNDERDDAAVLDLGDGTAVISTTDFFMPIVDDAFTFGRIAAANAISDIYAMGGSPLMAIAILGWPVNAIPSSLAGEVVKGAQRTCQEAGIPLAGGHSIDSPEPIFGLAVTGRVDVKHIKKNGGANTGDVLFLTKPLGIGILSTAQKKGLVTVEHEELAARTMMQLNTIGEKLGKISGVTAMTDVTGFGLGGHLLEMCKASNKSAQIHFEALPLIDESIHDYIEKGCVPGGTNRNHDSYGLEIDFRNSNDRFILCDPQTSGGLLIAVNPDVADEVRLLLQNENLYHKPIGNIVEIADKWIKVV